MSDPSAEHIDTGEVTQSAPGRPRLDFHCLDCGFRFKRQARKGYYARCPKCKNVAAGPKVLDQLMRRGVQAVAAEPPAPRRKPRSSPKPHDRPAASPVVMVNQGTPKPAAPAAAPPGPSDDRPPARRPSFLARILGAPDDDEDDQ